MASTLLMKLIATDDQPFDKEIQEANAKLLRDYLEELKAGTTNFEVARYLSNALNYTFGFMKAKLVAEDISPIHEKGARSLGEALSQKPWKATEEQAASILAVLDIWEQIIAQSSANLVREIQHNVDTVRPEAKKLKEREKMRRNKLRKKR